MQQQDAQNHFTQLVDQPLQPGEEELSTRVANILMQNGFPQEAVNILLSDPNIQFARGRNNNVQRYKLNVFLNTQYLMVPSDTQNERSLLLDSGSIENWVELFTTIHVPAMRSFFLPRPYPAVV